MVQSALSCYWNSLLHVQIFAWKTCWTLIHRRLGPCLIFLMLLNTLRGRTFPELVSTAPSSSPKLHLKARTHTIPFCYYFYYLTLFFPPQSFCYYFTLFFSPLKTWCFYLKSHPLQFVLSWQQDSLPCPKPIPRLIVLITRRAGSTLHTDEPLHEGCSRCSWTGSAPAMGLWLHQKKGKSLAKSNFLYSKK